MKFALTTRFVQNQGETIAIFGDARFINHNGKVELVGGSLEDRRAARDWCSMFLHEAVFECEA